MQKIKPVGNKLIVFPLPKEDFKTDGGIFVLDSELQEAEIMEVSDELSEVYSVGDTVIIPIETGQTVNYKKKSCLWVNSQIDVWGILTEDKE